MTLLKYILMIEKRFWGFNGN